MTITYADHDADCITRAAQVLAASGDFNGLALTSRQQYDAAADALESGDIECDCPSRRNRDADADDLDAAAAADEPQTVAYLTTRAGWGAWVRVTVADTPEADAAAAAFFARACRYEVGMTDYAAAHVDEEHTTTLGPAMGAYFFPECEHGLSAHLCAGPGHYSDH